VSKLFFKTKFVWLPNGPCLVGRRLFLVVLSMLAANVLCMHLRAQTPSKEYELKAVLLWRLAQYTDFPAEAFENAQSPVIIGVLGDNPFGDALRLAARGEKAHGRNIEVHYFKEVADITECHLLFVSESERLRVRSITSDLRRRSILTVSDIEGFARDGGGMVRFAMEKGKVTLIVNLEAVNAAGLKLDGRLLRMADIVKR
jgi:hypothetical protein